MIKYNFISICYLCIAVFFCSSCIRDSIATDQKHEHSEETEILPENIVELRDDQSKVAGIVLGSIEYKDISNTLKVSGFVAADPQNNASVCFPMGGFVKSTSLVPGSAVSKGQTLAVLQNQDFVDIQQNYIEARNLFQFAEAEYNRHTELFEEDVYSKKNVQKTTAEYKNLKVLVKALEQKLAMIGISAADLDEDDISSDVAVVSPISGFVRSVNINMGKYVSATDVLFEIVNSDNLLLELTLYEKDVDKVAVGQNIRFIVNNESESHRAVIYQTGKSVDKDKTYKVYARVQGTCKRVLPGMYVNAEIEISGINTTTLPSDAIVNFNDKDYIFVFEKEKEEEGKPFTEYRMIEIEKGFTYNGFTEVRLPAGFDVQNSKVVIKGAYNLLSAKKNAGEMAC